MWSALSQDFSDLTEVLKSESAGLMGYLEHMASNAVGGSSGLYAGDEFLGGTFRDMPIPSDLLQRLQGSEATYTTPIGAEEEEEEAAFASWVKSSPLSSAKVRSRQPEKVPGTLASKSESDSTSKTPEQSPPRVASSSRRSAESLNELVHEARQRLLCNSKLVLEQYLCLVGDTVGSSTSISASPATPHGRQRQTDAASAAKLGEGEDSVAVSAETPTERLPVSPRSGPQVSASGRISADDFFDRYFFRLMQLRLSHSQGLCEALKKGEAEDTLAASTPLSSFTPPTQSPSSSSRALTRDDVNQQSPDADDFVSVPLFARRVITAASGFVAKIDNALNNVVVGDTSRVSSADGEVADELDEDAANVEPKDLVHYRSPRRQIADLELVVQELQEALRQERHRVAQLTRVLEEKGIEVPAVLTMPSPPSAAESSAKKGVVGLETVLTPVRYTDVYPAAPAGAAAAVSFVRDASAATPLTDTALAIPLNNQKTYRALPSSKSISGDVLSTVTEEEDAWVNINSGTE
ncbi:hypothetical protein JKF63_04627 [Porcisia hertigi]|uniref:Uncharacterized protein n=1 Tax=Porcisia hertigi TaxID=2761500 RepID=A0A836HN47_9TRYP|nr:hypothetical protein JKF63_04627 [Porcisia hertigi]